MYVNRRVQVAVHFQTAGGTTIDPAIQGQHIMSLFDVTAPGTGLRRERRIDLDQLGTSFRDFVLQHRDESA